MGIFGNKKEKILDWSEKYQIPERRVVRRTDSENNDSSDLGFLGNLANSGTSSNSDVVWDNDSSSSSPQVEDYPDKIEKKQKLTRRFLDMTNKIEDLENQIYHLKQRIEVLEKKLKIKFG